MNKVIYKYSGLVVDPVEGSYFVDRIFQEKDKAIALLEDDIDVKYCHSHSWTIAMILREAEKIEALLNIPIRPATEKQINYILKLAKRSKEDDRYLNKDINIHQASALIELYKEIEDCIYSRSCYSYGWLEIASDKLEAQFALLKEKA